MAQPAPPSTGSGLVAFVKPLVIGLVIAVAFVLIYLAALHDPRPYHLAVGAVAPAAAVGELEKSLATDAVELQSFADAETARQAVLDGDVVAAYLPGAPGSPHSLLVAGAHGSSTSQVVVGIFEKVAGARHTTLQVDDIVPLADHDPRGFSIFYLIFGITLGAFIFGQTSHLYSKQLSQGKRLLQALAFAAFAGAAGAYVAGTVFQVVPGSVIAIAGLLALLAGAAGLVTMVFTRYLGDPGIALSTLLIVILGNATSGGAIPAAFLPNVFRQISPTLPPGATTDALRDIAYFSPGKAWQPIAVLAAWTFGSILLLLLGRTRGPRLSVPPPAEKAPPTTADNATPGSVPTPAGETTSAPVSAEEVAHDGVGKEPATQRQDR